MVCNTSLFAYNGSIDLGVNDDIILNAAQITREKLEQLKKALSSGNRVFLAQKGSDLFASTVPRQSPRNP